MPKRNENRPMKKITNLYTNIHSSIIHNSPKWKCPSTNEEINKMWYIHATEYHSAIQREKY
jgi:hypothetical protein